MLDSFVKLKNYCEKENYKGWDPYDGLNSKIFQKIPLLRNSAFFRLLMIQGFKRMPFNLRPLALIPKEYNPKGIGLFLTGYCNIYRAVSIDSSLEKILGRKEELMIRINELASLLISLRSKGEYHGACWGYNFDWQARRLFLFPKFTPTVVATNFCASALIDAYEITNNREYLDLALSSAEFIIQDLHRTDYQDGFLFSYSPLSGNDMVYNASLLGSRLLSLCYKFSGDKRYKILAEKSIKACCFGQKEDGSWVYGMLPVQSWVDSFHTGYNIDALTAYKVNTKDSKYDLYLEKGLNYYIGHFFEQDGTPKYYNNKIYPIDIHCPGQFFVTLSRTGQYKHNYDLVHKVIDWTINNMQDSKGYFYYQLKPIKSSKIPYMRWSNAFMFYALSYAILEEVKLDSDK